MSKERRPWNPYPLASLSAGDKFDLSAGAISVLMYLAMRSDYTGKTSVGQRRVADDLRRSKDFITSAIKELESKGVISLERRDRRKGLASITTISSSILPVKTEEPINPVPDPSSIPPSRTEEAPSILPSVPSSILTGRTEPCVVLDLADKTKSNLTTTTTSLLCCAGEAKAETQTQPEISVSGYTLTEIKAHLDTLVEFGHKWATENADGINRLAPKWVEHIMTLKVPRGAKRRFEHRVEKLHLCPDCKSAPPADEFEIRCQPCLDKFEAAKPKPSFEPVPVHEPFCFNCGLKGTFGGHTLCKSCRKGEQVKLAEEKAARKAALAAQPSLKDLMNAQ